MVLSNHQKWDTKSLMQHIGLSAICMWWILSKVISPGLIRTELTTRTGSEVFKETESLVNILLHSHGWKEWAQKPWSLLSGWKFHPMTSDSFNYLPQEFCMQFVLEEVRISVYEYWAGESDSVQGKVMHCQRQIDKMLALLSIVWSCGVVFWSCTCIILIQFLWKLIHIFLILVFSKNEIKWKRQI